MHHDFIDKYLIEHCYLMKIVNKDAMLRHIYNDNFMA